MRTPLLSNEIPALTEPGHLGDLRNAVDRNALSAVDLGIGIGPRVGSVAAGTPPLTLASVLTVPPMPDAGMPMPPEFSATLLPVALPLRIYVTACMPPPLSTLFSATPLDPCAFVRSVSPTSWAIAGLNELAGKVVARTATGLSLSGLCLDVAGQRDQSDCRAAGGAMLIRSMRKTNRMMCLLVQSI
jgi:hypothetical protein